MKIKRMKTSNVSAPVQPKNKIPTQQSTRGESLEIKRRPGRPAKKKPTENSGHTIYKFSDPIQARLLKPGMTIIYAEHECEVIRVKKAIPDTDPDLLVINIDKHPIRGSSTIVSRRYDIFHRSIESVTAGD